MVYEILSISEDKTIREWDSKSGKCLQVYEWLNSGMNNARYNTDERRVLLESSDEENQEWDIESGEYLQIYERHEWGVNSAEYSTDGRRILTASSDQIIREWDKESGKCIRVYKGHNSGVNSAEYIADGLRVLSASSDNTIREWNAENGKCLNIISHYSGLNIMGCSFKNATFASTTLEQIVRQYGGTLFRTHLERIYIKKLAHLSELEIAFSGDQLRHLMITGKNGSGKTALLDSINNCLTDFANDNEKLELSSSELALEFYGHTNKSFITDLRNWFKREQMVYQYFPAKGRIDDKWINDISALLIEAKLIAEGKSSESVKYTQFIKAFESGLKELFTVDNDPFYFEINTCDEIGKNEVYLHESGKRHSLTALPHGYQALLSIFGTLRVIIYKQRGFPETTSGLVLIDEPEIYLHTELQKKFVPNLLKMFPHIQFIITTHSPFILSTVKNTSFTSLTLQ